MHLKIIHFIAYPCNNSDIDQAKATRYLSDTDPPASMKIFRINYAHATTYVIKMRSDRQDAKKAG